ncbi:uncharacterized protein [Porites lutea]|uniref:uncharacterized protein n=1 Tax=Porites lutea TaxID=51062 RepID=UPI003CC60B16
MEWFELSLIRACFAAFLCFGETEARDYCGKFDGRDIYCDEGQCCGDFECCSYYKYYKMWWFWLAWGVICIFACCCAYHRRRNFAYQWQIRNFMYPTVLHGESGNTASYQQFENTPEYKLPSYAEVEAMDSLGPPEDGEGAPPPYVDPTANEELQEENTVSQETV